MGVARVRRRVVRRVRAALPVRSRGRFPGPREPVQRDVVEDVVSREVAGRLVVDEGAGDLVIGVGVVVGQPRCQRDGRVQQCVPDRLRPRRLLEEVAEAPGFEAVDCCAGGLFLVGFLRHLGFGQRREEQVGVDADQPIGCLLAHPVGDGRAYVPALGHVAGVAEATASAPPTRAQHGSAGSSRARWASPRGRSRGSTAERGRMRPRPVRRARSDRSAGRPSRAARRSSPASRA